MTRSPLATLGLSLAVASTRASGLNAMPRTGADSVIVRIGSPPAVFQTAIVDPVPITTAARCPSREHSVLWTSPETGPVSSRI